MSGSKEGAAKAQATIRKKYGLTPDGKSVHHTKAGSRGGSTKPAGLRGFAADPERASKAGKLGGSLGKRGKKRPL
jgi:general stress protein YciG